MHRAQFGIVVGLLVGLAGCGGNSSMPVVVPTASHTATIAVATATLRPSATATPSATITNTATVTLSPSCVCTPTASPTRSFTATPTVTPIPTGPIALFSNDALDPANPFPSDRLLDDTGHVHVTGALIGADLPADSTFDTARDLSNTVADQLTALTGFSTFAPIRVKVDRVVIVPELAQGDVVVLQLDDLQEAPVTVAAVTPDISGDYAIEIQPVLPLKPKTRYVYAVTRSAAHDADGHALIQSADLSARLHGHGPADAATTTWLATLAPVLSKLHERFSITVDDIVAIDTFTTQSIADDLIAIRDVFDSGRLPAADPVFDNSPIRGLTLGVFAEGTPEFQDLIGSATSPNVSAVAIGVFDSYDFRTAEGIFDPDRIALRTTPKQNHLDFYMTIPKTPPPPGGYPITIFGHGLGGSGRNTVFVSQLIGDAPMMAIGISDVQHGRRGSMANFFVLSNGFITRENFRQTIVDYLQLARMIRHTTVGPLAQVDKTRINYMGVSLGGIMGTLYMGVESLVKVGMLSVPGGGLPSIIQSAEIGRLLKPLIANTAGIALDDPLFPVFFYRFSQLSQWYIDPADPINLAPYILDPTKGLPGVPPKSILVHEGIVDNVLPNFTTDALALTMGLPDAKATHGCTSSDSCSGIWRFVMTEYGQPELSGHGVTGLIPEAGAQAGNFLATDGHEISDAAR